MSGWESLCRGETGTDVLAAPQHHGVVPPPRAATGIPFDLTTPGQLVRCRGRHPPPGSAPGRSPLAFACGCIRTVTTQMAIFSLCTRCVQLINPHFCTLFLVQIELYGPANSGKSAVVLQAIVAAILPGSWGEHAIGGAEVRVRVCVPRLHRCLRWSCYLLPKPPPPAPSYDQPPG
jgi:hypothetical protein